jgi:hypothetical protein
MFVTTKTPLFGVELSVIVVGKVALGHVFLSVLVVSPVSIIPPLLHTHSFITTDAV